MATSSLTWLRAAVVLAIAAQAAAQTCYYPNGSAAPGTEKPCSSAQGSACCPDTWECLDNGLCHNPNGNLYGRYSCTDKDWNAPGCASNMCTYGGAAAGGESIKQCSDHNNDWCCNADDTNVKCCQESPAPRPFFQLQDGRAYATIGRNQASSAPTLSSVTGLATGSGSASASRTSAPTSSGPPPSRTTPVTSATPFSSEFTSVSSGPGGVSTIIRSVLVTPSLDPTANAAGAGSNAGEPASASDSNSNLGVIIGCAVGIPLALALLGIVIWMLRKRRNQKKADAYRSSPKLDGDSPGAVDFAGGAAATLNKTEKYRHSRPGTTEIDGNPAGPGRPISNIPGRAELDSGAGFQPGHGTAYAPDTVGIGGGNSDGRSTWGSAPPGYSPGMSQAGFSQPPTVSELDGTSILPVINEKAAPADAPQQYQAYRPPQPVAELSTIKTPPEDVGKQLHKATNE
ncbi:hypothetical protein BDU57DRAFT_540189 [Ampelomyces quisqualis]|uniref:Mid2 domain-containing protein n=1 Tax=Ampelomyces quisqualis TaxID=50730 RepID=A0A6A5QFG2_AMPQU|nr:hypothetical protein BDU57DRAFT_540189 [Ampelomyces quisqualis]